MKASIHKRSYMKQPISVAILCCVCIINACAQSFTEIPLVQDHWAVTDKSEVSFERFEGRQAVQLNGTIRLIGTALEEGIISVDIFCSPERSFSGMFFHQEEENSEKVYFRQHKSGQADAAEIKQ